MPVSPYAVRGCKQFKYLYIFPVLCYADGRGASIMSVMLPTNTPLSDPVCYDVVSSFISQIAYVPNDSEMTVRFISGSDYTYTDVTREQFDDVRLSESVGKALHAFKENL